jgi:hypothetical protein
MMGNNEKTDWISIPRYIHSIGTLFVAVWLFSICVPRYRIIFLGGSVTYVPGYSCVPCV